MSGTRAQTSSAPSAPSHHAATDHEVPPVVAALQASATRIETPLPGGHIVWHTWGTGPALVLVHGGSGSWLHWVHTIEALARTARVIAVDLPGLGDSSAGPDPFDPEIWTAHILAGLDAIIGPAAPFGVAGFSFGGIFAGHMARLAGGRARAVALIGSAGFGRDDTPKTWTLKSWRKLPTRAERDAAHRHNLAELMLHDPAAIDDLALYVQASSTARSRIDTRGYAVSGSLLRILPEIAAPITAIFGEMDPTAMGLIEKRRAQLRAAQPDCTIVVLPGVGHWAMFEAPHVVNALLADMVERALAPQD